MKQCKICLLNLKDSEFEKWKCTCKKCRYIIKNNRNRNKNYLVDLDLKEKRCNKCKLWKEVFLFGKKKENKDGLNTVCKECRKIYSKIAYSRHSEKIKENRKNYYKNNKEKVITKMTIYKKMKFETDPFYRMTRRLRNRLYYALKNTTWKKNTHFTEYIGCDRDTLISHIQSQFTEGMTWDNLGDWHIDHKEPLSLAKTEEELYKLCHYTNLQPLWAKDNLSKSNKIK